MITDAPEPSAAPLSAMPYQNTRNESQATQKNARKRAWGRNHRRVSTSASPDAPAGAR